ncbi:ankyrin and het domain protein, partial [Colletotrichum plurivorum]
MHRFPAPVLNPVDNLSRLFYIFDAVAREDFAALTLERLLDSFASFESFDPRDGIYAFLSMASDLR